MTVGNNKIALAVERLTVEIPARIEGAADPRLVRISADVTLAVQRGESLGLVGESGCGKSMTLRALSGLLPRSSRASASEVIFDGRNVDLAHLASAKGQGLSMIFQDPERSLDPVWTVGWQLEEVIRAARRVSRRSARVEATALFERVGLEARRMRAYPHELSGGMRQRVGIALAIASRAGVLLADEPTTALDVTTQQEILLLLKDLQAETGMAIILVTHDLAVVHDFCDDVAVMYAGRIVERGAVRRVLSAPRHPYTRALLDSLPRLERADLPKPIPGAPPEFEAMPTGCPFQPRCAHTVPHCAELSMAAESQKQSACPIMASPMARPTSAPPADALLPTRTSH